MGTPLEDAEAHLTKAREFLDASEFEEDGGLYNAAASSAVLSGINSKDAICLKLTGTSAKGKNHATAVSELRNAGQAGAQVANALGKLLRMKTRAQYQTTPVAQSDARSALRWATQLYKAAEETVRR